MKKIKIILFGLLFLQAGMLLQGCRKSYSPGDWNLLPEKEPEKPQEPDDTPTKSFKVMSLNMNVGSTVANFDAMVDLIKEYDPDLLFLRQVDSATTRAGKVDRPGAIAKALKMDAYFKKNIDYQTGGFGNAVLSKFPIKEKYSQLLSREEGNTAELRSMAMIKVEVQAGHELYFAGTELDPSVAANRALQVVDLLNITEKLTQPVILVGNLNEQESANGPVLSYLKGSFTFACLGTGCPYNAPKDNPTGVFDYITFKTPEDKLQLSKYGTFSKSSNNFLPMTAEFKLKLPK
ncbi:endonuclease/exonuclease/phosphatase family protein [Sphingobacterium sp. DR205]|uniref:endonuclease/exonuclease/phosphatase family protein n=1 Tax=Sphingobacterium sp. DR205 TaxID=2713573 RepID=UPI0013E42E57|nr:endonuclease/exonuclease/phosphatase family protein [Sphingobacterium sp. DR205]QIH31602.1 endonuclease/exonuclease/phosphatase family protein [Sphingobacterium sp. DR205]